MNQLKHYIAIVGGAVSGSETAFQFAEKGIKVAVLEQNALPYGKIEDGLPKWHVKLRDKEERKINEKLSHHLVRYVPKFKVGKEVSIQDLVSEVGFSAVVLANGAWKDRGLPIEGIDEYIGKGLYYQNPFIYWYNHHHEPDYTGQSYDWPDGAVIIGGGLASLDVAKVLMFKNVEKALKDRGIETDLFELDRSIAKVLEKLDLSLDDLGIEGCTLYYRRRVIDMPLTPMATDTPEMLQKAQNVRQKVFNNYQSKYLFKFEPLHSPYDKIIENGKLVGIKFQKTEVVNGRVKGIEGKFIECRAPLFISSIGSIPLPMEGVKMDGSVYDVDECELCKVAGYQQVYAVGNAVTGRGNILESMKHARKVSGEILDSWGLKVSDKLSEEVAHVLENLPEGKSEEELETIDKKISEWQEKVAYSGDLNEWVEKHLPKRLENILGKDH
jgi:NADPH-dependent glutamate synthase beta subunit-like oxidoreductase